ncbi:sugar ABC transporter substrate-binding protein [Saccharothrix sp. ALI-22-I]|uniref:ABC transporter substrate-binding protein n=1 Tax=Saccharothrix sp. ALI-22-I TaxID=1933778 RepID=UPI00097CB51C|nr:sugar ABC transporter substrate-binding protein [Saccharothrix sp. ALI-22-I]ONI80169.1 sugar ABC transporter substrate-binding protein [Saccharothrix sp. ALI-22-I]
MVTPNKPREGGRRGRVRKALVALTAVALVTAGCGSGGAADETGPVTLTVSVWNLAATPEFQAVFDAFEAANPDVTVEPVDILAEDYPAKVTTMLAGGDTTDVITMKNVTDYSRYASRGQLAEVTDLVQAKGDAKLAGLDAFDVEGKYFALPYRNDYWVLYYNKKLFDAAGIAYPENLTWDQYADVAKKLTKGEGEQKVYGTYHHTWRSVIQAISAAQTDSDQITGDFEFFADQYKMALDLQQAGATLDFGSAKQASYRTMFETEKTAMMPMGTWYVAGVLKNKAEGKTAVDWGIAPMPQRPGASGITTFGSPTAFAVNKKAKHAATAKKFVEFAAGMDGAKAITKVGVVPSLQSPEITEAYAALEGMPRDELAVKSLAPDTTALEMPVSEHTSDVDTILREEHELIMVGEKSVEDGIKSMRDRVKKVLD